MEDLTGQVFGNLKVIGYNKERADEFFIKHKAIRHFWNCKCVECGYETSTSTNELNKVARKGTIGCKECFYRRDLLGKRVGKLVVIAYNGSIEGNRTWLCQCDCGNTKILTTGDLSRKKPTLSCGCLKTEVLIKRNVDSAKYSGDSTNPEFKRLYNIWRGMLVRCEDSKHADYKYYGAKGVKVCDQWHDWYEFKEWSMSHGYTDSLTIDRIKNDGNYEPSNCRWATVLEQANNTTRNIRITINNKTQTLAQWCRELQVDYDKARRAIKELHYTPEQAFELGKYPAQRINGNKHLGELKPV